MCASLSYAAAATREAIISARPGSPDTKALLSAEDPPTPVPCESPKGNSKPAPRASVSGMPSAERWGAPAPRILLAAAMFGLTVCVATEEKWESWSHLLKTAKAVTACPLLSNASKTLEAPTVERRPTPRMPSRTPSNATARRSSRRRKSAAAGLTAPLLLLLLYVSFLPLLFPKVRLLLLLVPFFTPTPTAARAAI